MLHEFVNDNRVAIIARAKKRIASRIAPIATRAELEDGVGLFLDDLISALEPARQSRTGPSVALQNAFTVAQVVYDFGDICQSITAEIAERDVVIEAREFRILNQCLDDAIASAVTEFTRRQRREAADRNTEQLTAFVEEMRPLLSSALLAFEMVQRGTVGASGSTGALVGRSLRALRKAMDSTLAIARLDRDAAMREPVLLANVLEEIEVSAAIEARGRGVRLAIASMDGLRVLTDRDIIATALTGLLESAIQSTKREQTVHVRVTDGASITVSITGGAPTDGADHDALLFAARAVGACGGTLATKTEDGARQFSVELPRVESDG